MIAACAATASPAKKKGSLNAGFYAWTVNISPADKRLLITI